MKLPHSENSLWRDSYKDIHYPQLQHDQTADVVVVGAGITGLTSAYLLKRAGLKVIVLDKDTVGGGTTGRTTGKVTAQHNLIYDRLIQSRGKDVAQMYADANQAALEKVQQIIDEEKIECDWKRDDNYVYTTDSSQAKTFQDEAAAAQSLGLPAEFMTSSPLPFEIAAAVKFSNQAKFNAQKYLLGVAAAVHGDDSYVYQHSNVIGIHDGDVVKVRTSQATITARYGIVATNVPTLPLMARGTYCRAEYPNESYIVAGVPSKKVTGMYISSDKNNYSILPIDVDGVSMILVGGEGHLSGLRFGRKRRFRKLAQYAWEHFGVEEITHMWSDRDYLSYDGVPLVGKVYNRSKHLFVGTGFMKWGMTNGTAAGLMISDMILDKENPWAEAFDPARIKTQLAAMPRAVATETHKLLP